MSGIGVNCDVLHFEPSSGVNCKVLHLEPFQTVPRLPAVSYNDVIFKIQIFIIIFNIFSCTEHRKRNSKYF